MTSHFLSVIDFQTKLFGIMDESERSKFLKSSMAIIGLFQDMGSSVIITEQYPEGLGPTIDEILIEKCKTSIVISKKEFDFTKNDSAKELIEGWTGRPVLLGMEAHICVALSAKSLCDAGRKPIVLSDCIISRDLNQKAQGLSWMKDQGVEIMSSETLAFSLLGTSKSEYFKSYSKAIR